MSDTKRKMQAKHLEGQIDRPNWLSKTKCWHQVRRYTGSMFPAYSNCEREGVVKDGERRYCRQHAKQRGLIE